MFSFLCITNFFCIHISLTRFHCLYHIASSIKIPFLTFCLFPFQMRILMRLNAHHYGYLLLLRSNATYFAFKNINSTRRTTLINKYKNTNNEMQQFRTKCSQRSFPDGSFNPSPLYLLAFVFGQKY